MEKYFFSFLFFLLGLGTGYFAQSQPQEEGVIVITRYHNGSPVASIMATEKIWGNSSELPEKPAVEKITDRLKKEKQKQGTVSADWKMEPVTVPTDAY